MDIEIFANAAEVAAAAADLIVDNVNGGATTLGLAGGTTPSAAYRLLPGRDVDWSKVTLWLGDERWVSVSDPDSNAGMAKTTFVDQVGARLLLPEYDAEHPARAASQYEAELFDAFEGEGPGLVFLGMGDDGHTASLFPETHALELTRAGYVANWVGSKDAWRLTATMPLLWSADHLVFVVTGATKAAVLARILDRNLDYPAQRVAAGASRVTWLIDEDAASALSR